MRLINARRLFADYQIHFEEFEEPETPKYVILSHRWGNEEVKYQEALETQSCWLPHLHSATCKSGFRKIHDAARLTLVYECEYLWSDTCCIDKQSSAELTESINSMYKWYKNAHLCFAYLADIDPSRTEDFTKSVWFERCWTLQELLAPRKVIFFDQVWNYFGTKHDRSPVDRLKAISLQTGIDEHFLEGKTRLERFSVAQRMSWAADRKALKVEDIAYSLLGIFDVNMPMLYGEGRKAFVRLQEEIMQRNADESIFAWGSSSRQRTLFASSPADFKNCRDVRVRLRHTRAFSLNNFGLDIELFLQRSSFNTYLALLACEDSHPGRDVGILLEIDQETDQLCRAGSSRVSTDTIRGPRIARGRRCTVLRGPSYGYVPKTTASFCLCISPASLPLTPINDWDIESQWDLGRWQQSPKGPDQPNLIHFSTPPDVSTSIAMCILSLPTSEYLIQLAFDFDFNPCCHISKTTIPPKERFRRRAITQEAHENRALTWPDDPHDWTNYERYKETWFEDPNTGQKCWVAKSVNRQNFEHANVHGLARTHLQVSFFKESTTMAWEFAIKMVADAWNIRPATQFREGFQITKS